MNRDVIFSSKTDLWETPQKLFDELNEEFAFTLDVCANSENTKCSVFYSPEDDGLKQQWFGRCWCNPPYSRNIGEWVKKAIESNTLVVMLLPARTDTKWFHDCLRHGEIRFIKGRLKFGEAKNNAPFPSIIVIFRPSEV